MAQDVVGHRRHVDAGEVQLARRAGDARGVAGHLRRLAEQDLQRHVDRRLADGADRREDELAVVTGDADDGERAALAVGTARRSARATRARSPGRSAPGSRCTTPPCGASPLSSSGTARSSNVAPTPASLTSSGNAFDSPPAPTSWMERIGLSSPRDQQWLMTSCARRSISGLPRCTESKSSSAALAPAACDEAAPPPMPMRMPGPPSCTSRLPAGNAIFCGHLGTDRAQAAGAHDRLVVAAAHAVDGLLVDAEEAAEAGAAELVVERRGADRALGHDVQRAARCGRACRTARSPTARRVPGRCRFDTTKPVRPALGCEPRPVAPSSRISPPAPVAAPG